MTDPLSPAKKYPGRNRVMSRDSARDYVWRRTAVRHAVQRDVCTAPIELPAIGLPSGVLDRGQSPLAITLEARCRKCEACLAHRRRLWTARAVDEITASRRTWFGTLTVSPENRVALRYRAEKARLRASREQLSSLGPDEQFRILAAQLSVEATKWLKRVRAQAGVPLRYLLVTEAHKSGDPHMHILLHETADPVTKRLLEAQWKYGFSHWRLVEQDRKAAVYVCKYLAKDALTRVRASSRYGQPALVRSLTERVSDVSDAVTSAPAASERTKSPSKKGSE